ncbi:MAG TPA: OmpA family protein, partial [Candidatus Solibacter sp.]|nr:OmpA family protein [Candidatus Solibacter sp.]
MNLKGGSKLFKVRILLSCFICSAIFSATGTAQNTADFDSVPPKQLFDQAWRTTGVQEKLAIRSYLAAKYPDTDMGLLSRAWIADHDGDAKAAESLYNQCMQRYPKFLYCLNNASILLSDQKQRLELDQRGMEIDPSFDNFSLVRAIYFVYTDTLKDKKAADAFLATWEARYPDAFIFPFIRGLYSEFNARELNQAETFYQAAAAKGPNQYELATRLAAVRLKRAEAASAGEDEKAAALTAALEFAKAHVQSAPLEAYNALMYAAGVYKTDFKSHAPDLYLAAFRLRPTDDAASEAANLLLHRSKAAVKDFMQAASKAMPHSCTVLKYLAYLTEDAKEAQAYYEEAIARSPSPGERTESTILIAQRLFEDRLLDYDHAHQLLKGLLKQPVHISQVYAALFNDRLEAADFPLAKQYLDQYEGALRGAGSDVNENYFRQYNALLSYYLNNEREAERYYEKNPFLLYWQKQFGESLRTSINFGSDSDVIPPSDYSKLDEVARLLTDKGAGQYIFAVEGHTDNAGPDSVNLPLSRRRAEAIARYLQTVKHIAPERLRTSGHGSLHPIASNATEQGRAQNRRVEILPVGSLTSPRIVATAALPQSAEGETQNDEADPGLNSVPEITGSPDGRYLAVGRDPMELWDSETGIRVKQFGFAGFRRFSPNSRYIASLSEYRFPGNIVRKTLFVDDVKTGLRVVQQPLFYGANDVTWDPFSSRIAYLNDNGQVCIYDMRQHRRTSCVNTSGKLITGRILWTHDGRYILSAKAQEHAVSVWEAESLKLVRTLDGINWPHGLAETSDGHYIVCTDNQRVITVWDTRTWEARQERIPNLADQILPHPDKPLMMLGDFGGGAHQHGTLFDVSSMQIVGSLEEGPGGARYAFSADGRKLFRSKPGEISVLDAATLKQIGSLTGAAVSARGGTADAGNDRYISFDDAGVHVWDIKTGRRIHSWPQVVDRLARISQDQILAVHADSKTGKTQLWMLNTSTVSASELPSLQFRVDRVAVRNDAVAFGGTAFVASNRGAENGVVEIFDRKSWERRASLRAPLVTENLEYGSIAGSRIDSLDVAPDGSAVALVSAWMDGFGHPYTFSKDVRVFDVASGLLAERHNFSGQVSSVAFPDHDHLQVTLGNGTWSVERKTDARTAASEQVSGETVLPLRDGARIIWSRAAIRKMQAGGAQVLNTNDLVDVEVFKDRNLLVALSGSNEISFYALADLSKVITLISKRNGEWIAYAPSNEFSASPNGTDKVSWSLGDRLLAFKTLASRFERTG